MNRFENILTSSVAGIRMFAASSVGGLFLAVPGLAAALGAGSYAQPVVAADLPEGLSATRINDADMVHMNAFPAEKKAWVLEQIMAVEPLQKTVRMENLHYEKVLLKLRDDGFALVDVQPQETAFTSVWYRNGRPDAAGENVAMLLWEALEVGDSTTVMMWRV